VGSDDHDDTFQHDIIDVCVVDKEEEKEKEVHIFTNFVCW